MSDPDGPLSLQAWCDALAETHDAFYAENPTGERLPVCLIELSNALICVVLNGDRDELIAGLRRMLRDPKIQRYAVITEAWLGKARGEAAKAALWAAGEQRQIHTLPDRIEVICTTCVARSGETAIITQEVVRDADGAVGGLRRNSAADAVAIGGAFANLFNPE